MEIYGDNANFNKLALLVKDQFVTQLKLPIMLKPLSFYLKLSYNCRIS